jgi:cyclophilin family peptidyl-prolyl cis-trans isomerase
MRRPLRFEQLEDRCVPSANFSGVISGTAFIDANSNGVLDPGETTLPGVSVTLSGSTNQGTPVNVVATTDANGAFTFQNVLPGTYSVSASAGSDLLGGTATLGGLSSSAGIDLVSGFVMTPGQTGTGGFGFRGLAPAGITLNEFLSSTTSSAFPFAASPGTGTAQANFRPDSAPIVQTAIQNVSVKQGSANTVLDLAGNFSDPDFTNSSVRLDLNRQAQVNLNLFDTKAPQTVANFFDYINSGAYNNSIFHRLVTNFVLQGGGFAFNSNPASLTPIPTNAPVPNEFGTSNTRGTVAMAKLGSDPNSATNQFFFNLADNSTNLDTQNGGFTVFGQVASPADQAVVDALAVTSIKDESKGNSSSPFNSIPLVNYSGTNFPTDTTADNYLLIKDVTVTKRDEFLTYSVVSNTNPGLVTPSVGTSNNEMLTLQYTKGQTGTATITVRATDRYGASVTTSFTVTVS